MAVLNIPALFLLSCAFAGLSHGFEKQCITDQAQMITKVMTCVTKDHPEYFLTVLTNMDKPASMERPDFLCSHPGLVSAMVECLLQYVEDCFPPNLSSQIAAVMPTHQTVARGVQFLCDHMEDFKNPCVESQMINLVQCIRSKMQTFTQVTHSNFGNMREALCTALRLEEQCLAQNLAGCPAAVASDLGVGLLAFFPAEKCNIKVPGSNNTLYFKPRGPH